MSLRSFLHVFGLLFAIVAVSAFASPSPASAAAPLGVAPHAEDDVAVRGGNQCVVVDVLANDYDLDDDPISVNAAFGGTHAYADSFTASTVTVCAAAGLIGTDFVTYDITDGSSFASATIAVSNQAPVAVDDEDVVAMNACVTTDVISDDTDADGDPIVVSAATAGPNGSVSMFDAGSVTYCVAGGFTGTETYTYEITDGYVIDTGAVTLTVTNSLPVAADDVANTLRDQAVTVDVLINDSDADLNALTIASVDAPAHGTAAISGASIVYTPAAGFVGSDSFTYTVTDGDAGACGTCTATVSVTVAPQAPVVTAPANQTASEGTVKAFNLGSFADADVSASWSVAVNWGDGTATETFSVTSQGSLGARNHTFAADAIRTVTVTVTDGDGAVSEPASFTVTVANVAPNFRPGSTQAAVTGTAKSFYLGYLTDPGADDTSFTVTVDWGDGSAPESQTGPGTLVGGTNRAFNATHTYATGGAKTVTITAVDGDGGSSGPKTLTVNVNAAPVVTSPSNQTAVEGTAKTFDLGSFEDANGNGPWTVRIGWGDGTAAESFSVTATGALAPRPHTFGADGTRTVTVTVTDAANAAGTPKTFTVAIANVAPNLRAAGNQTGFEGTAKSFYLGYFTDPGTDDTSWATTVNWGDGSAAETFPGPGTLVTGSTSRTLYRNHTYGADGTYNVTVQVVDQDGGASVVRSFTITIANVAPNLRAGSTQVGKESIARSFYLGYFTDPGTDDSPWTITVDWGDGTTETFTGTGNPIGASRALYRTHAYTGSGSYTAAVTVVDQDGAASATKTFGVTVANLPPNLRPASNQTATASVSRNFYLGYLTDPGTDDTTWTLTVQWGDGTTSTITGPGTLIGTSHAFYATHAYATTGTKNVTVTAVDEDGGTSLSRTFSITVS